MLILAEYTRILFISILFAVVFLGGMDNVLGPLGFMAVAFLFV